MNAEKAIIICGLHRSLINMIYARVGNVVHR